MANPAALAELKTLDREVMHEAKVAAGVVPAVTPEEQQLAAAAKASAKEHAQASVSLAESGMVEPDNGGVHE